jgi:hypothetical protein
MSLVAPKGRKHLSADARFRLVRNGFARIADDRAEDTEISLPDALMSAFAHRFPVMVSLHDVSKLLNLGCPCDRRRDHCRHHAA